MTITPSHIRDARDRLIDLLGIGQTYPLRDLAVRDEQLTVTFNTPARIPVDASQSSVLYQLHHKHEPVERTAQGDQGPGMLIETMGNSQTIVLETYKIQEDVTFEILATKQPSGRAAYLSQTATVKVGLDTSLKAWLRDLPHLDPTLENPTDMAARIIHYGMKVSVEIENSQEGVDYRLVYFKEAAGGKKPTEVVISETPVRGDLHHIVLTTKPIYEDLDIRIRATKIFDPSENRATQVALLDAVLPLKVRANPALAVTVDPGPILDFNQPTVAKIKITNTQPNVRYRLYLRAIADRDFIHQTASPTEVIKVNVTGEPDVQVRRPPREAVWVQPDGFAVWGEAQAGDGGDLQLELPSLTADSLIIVQAEKTHQVSPTAQTVVSAVQLEQAAVVLVRPDPQPPLRIKVIMTQGQTNGQLYAFDGQPGVFYHFRRQPDGDNLGLPAYFHQRDDQDATMNKGLGQLTTGVDFVIARPRSSIAAGFNPAEAVPESPCLETGPLPADTVLYVYAVKAQTRLTTLLSQTAYIAATPEIHLEEEIVDAGASTKILVLASLAGDKYQPLLNGDPLKRARNGNGEDLSFATDPLTEDTGFEVVITRPDETGLVVERVVKLRATVRPEPGS